MFGNFTNVVFPKLWEKNGHRGQKFLTNFKDWSSETYDNTREKILRMKNKLQHRTEMKLKSTMGRASSRILKQPRRKDWKK
ncbi:hypothetical protein YC2023_046281 [Brassica napus]